MIMNINESIKSMIEDKIGDVIQAHKVGDSLSTTKERLFAYDLLMNNRELLTELLQAHVRNDLK
jgi:hypothetical protein